MKSLPLKPTSPTLQHVLQTNHSNEGNTTMGYDDVKFFNVPGLFPILATVNMHGTFDGIWGAYIESSKYLS